MTSQTEIAVLAALSLGPATGYAVRAGIRDHLGMFWHESFGQIYPALARLRATGLVEADAAERPGSQTFHLTDAGRSALVDALRDEPATQRPRNGVLLRVFFGSLLDHDQLIALVSDARERASAQLADLARARAESVADPRPESAYWLMTISAGEHAARATIAWADETLAALASGDAVADSAPRVATDRAQSSGAPDSKPRSQSRASTKTSSE